MSKNYFGVLKELQETYEELFWSSYGGGEKKDINCLDVVDLITDGITPWYFKGFKVIGNFSDEPGENVYAIFEWKEKFYKLQYFYQSHYGASYYGDGSEIKEVKPIKVEVTKYV